MGSSVSPQALLMVQEPVHERIGRYCVQVAGYRVLNQAPKFMDELLNYLSNCSLYVVGLDH